ncbi:MAG: DUF935 family protein, partial [Clostridiales bacterium]
KQAEPIVINQITVRPTQRKTLDIKDWRNAIKAADRGDYRRLYDLLEDIIIDNVLGDAIEKRKDAVVLSELVYKDKDGEQNDFIETLMDTQEFEELLRDVMDAKFYARNVDEIVMSPGGKLSCYQIPRKHLRPKFKEYVANESDERGYSYDFDNFIESSQRGYGLIYKVAQYVIYKRGNYGDWAQYVEIFGQPFRKAKYPNHDEDARKELMQALDQCGGRMTAVYPEGCNIETEAGATSGDGSVFEKLKNACNEEILIGILGQTMTTQDGSSLAQSKVHMTVQKDKHQADLKFVARVLNTQLIPFLVNRGFIQLGGYFMFPEAAEEISLKDRILIDEKIIKIISVPTSYFYDTYGLPRPKENEETVGGYQEPQVGAYDPAQLSDPEKVSLWDKFVDFFVEAPGKGAFNGVNPKICLNDEPGDDFNIRLAKRVAHGENYFDVELFNHISTEFKCRLNAGFTSKKRITLADGGVGLDYGVQNDAVITAMETNIFHFSAAKTLAEVQALNQAYRESKSYQEYLQKAAGITDKFNKVWAKTEYETAGLIAESTANYQRLSKKTNIFQYWEFRTVGDEKVRAEHQALNGLILPCVPRWKGDTVYLLWEKLFPPLFWKCRCYIVPRMSSEVRNIDINSMVQRANEYLSSPEHKMAAGSGFGKSRVMGGHVFEANQMYIKKFPQQAAKYLNKLAPQNWGMSQSLDKYQKQAAESLNKSANAAEWFEHRQHNDNVYITDYNKRALVFTRKQFENHT